MKGDNMKLKPIVKWAGGKRQIINQLIEFMPKVYNTYYEPFFGGGALLLELSPKKAVINDINQELVAMYKTLKNKDDFKLMINKLKEHEAKHSKEYYYEIREVDRKDSFKDMPDWEKAARMIYLNKSCFNGLYRVNKKGYFNVPFGQKKEVKTFDEDNILNVHKYFKENDIEILLGDFKDVVVTAAKGDFVYFDPPYDPIEDKNSFATYSDNGFNKADQERLATTFKELSNKGVYVMLSNHNTEFIRNLYKDFNIHIINAKRMINANAKGRGDVEEVIITNY